MATSLLSSTHALSLKDKYFQKEAGVLQSLAQSTVSDDVGLEEFHSYHDTDFPDDEIG